MKITIFELALPISPWHFQNPKPRFCVPNQSLVMYFLTIVVVNSRSHLSDGAVFFVFLKNKKMKNVNSLHFFSYIYNTLQIYGYLVYLNVNNLNNRRDLIIILRNISQIGNFS